MAVDLLLIFIVFLVIQMVVNGLVTLVYVYLNHVDAAQFAQQVASGQQGQFVAATSVISSLLTILVYPRLKWPPLPPLGHTRVVRPAHAGHDPALRVGL